MVVFTCQNCNSCLKKKAVENHLYKCKNPQLTCIDCLKDFDSKSYIGHLTCVTENERYGGQSFVPTSAMQKQNQWCQAIRKTLERNLSPPAVKNIVQFASDNPNCPKNMKKFINFILNNKAFKSREAAQTAFELISEEFNKSLEDNKKMNGESKEGVTSEKSGGGKRKTISETEVQETTDENATNSNEKISKKKNEQLNEEQQSNGITENGNTNQKKNKKKDKRNSSVNNNEESPKTNGHENEQEKVQNGEDSTQGKKKNKNKDKQRKNSSTEQNSTEDNLENTSEKENTPKNDEQITNSHGDVNGSTELPKDVDLSKLSKKERKKLLKQKKYEAEINSIENYIKEDEETAQAEEEQGEKRKKKKKKHQIEEEEASRQQKNSISEPEDKKIKLEVEEEPEEVQFEKPKKFKWDEVIIQVLLTQDDGEMSLKRLSKKICAEYANIYGERESYEEVLLKFNKKVIRTPGVRVFKDRAKLLADS